MIGDGTGPKGAGINGYMVGPIIGCCRRMGIPPECWKVFYFKFLYFRRHHHGDESVINQYGGIGTCTYWLVGKSGQGWERNVMKIYRYRSGAHQNSEISLLTFPYYLTLTSSRKCRTAHQLNLDVVQPVRYYNFISNRILPLQCNLHTYYLISRYFKIYCAKSTKFFSILLILWKFHLNGATFWYPAWRFVPATKT